jgi:hypothetical protein
MYRVKRATKNSNGFHRLTREKAMQLLPDLAIAQHDIFLRGQTF